MTAKTASPVLAPKDDLFRIYAHPEEIKIEHRQDDGSDGDGDGEGNTLVGYMAVFNEDTVIDSWEGQFIERFSPGAFKKTIRENGEKLKILYDHGFGDYAQPIAVPEVLKEDDRGLYIEARFIDTEASRTVKELVRSGAVDGMSIRFSVIKEEWELPDDDEDRVELPERTINEARVREGGPVTFPAYEATEAGVRGREAFKQWRVKDDDRGKIHGDDTEPPDGTPADEPPDGTRQEQVETLGDEIRRFLDERA